MRRMKTIPRILKVNWIDGLCISVVFNNGESRVINMQEVLTDDYITDDSPWSILLDPTEFAKVKLEDHTLTWHNVEIYIKDINNKKIRVPYDIGSDTLYDLSHPDKSEKITQIGSLIKSTRKKLGLTQAELADRSGTSRTYISRIENDRSDVELGTLRKIIEIGLDKKMEIRIS